MKALLFGTALAAWLFNGTHQAKADLAVYKLVVDSIGAGPHSNYPTTAAVAPAVSLVTSEGGASLDETGVPGNLPPSTVVTKQIGYVGFAIEAYPGSGGGDYADTGMISGYSFSFAQSGTDINFVFFGNYNEIQFKNGAGQFGTDAGGACNGPLGACVFTGRFVQTGVVHTPEPDALILLLSGMMGLGMAAFRPHRPPWGSPAARVTIRRATVMTARCENCSRSSGEH